MTNDSKRPPVIQGEISLQSKKSNNKLWTVLGIVIVLFIIAILWRAYGVTEMVKTATEKAQMESVLDAFMKHMTARDIESAHALISPRAQQQYTISYLQRMREGELSHSLFTGYQSLSVRKLDFTSTENTNPGIPQGADVITYGDISYEGGYSGTFGVVMEKVGGVWRIRELRGIFAQSH